jgi:hypothetical protein
MTLTTEAALKVSGLLLWTGMPSGSNRFIMTLEKSISLHTGDPVEKRQRCTICFRLAVA